jgi:hypothetical protein
MPWTGLAGSAELLDEVMADDLLDTELVDLTAELPYWRHP